MKIKNLFLLTLAIVFISFQACEKDDDDANESNISSYNSSESHKEGQDCMSCHTSGGNGEGWFTVAGTVYDSLMNSVYPNATVKLYTGPNGTGTLKTTIQVDRKGNFYTTENVDFETGLYTLVEGDMQTKYMISTITMGRCNSCHGANNRIWVY